MARDLRAYLIDVLEACDHLASFAAGRTLQEYERDVMLRSAVERQFEIVGEALRAATKQAPHLATRITDCAAIIAFRNQLTHAYSAIDHATVWGILQSRIATLKSEVQAILSELR